jgi:hypothetical protein
MTGRECCAAAVFSSGPGADASDARAADPVCHLSPHHHVVEELAAIREDAEYV